MSDTEHLDKLREIKYLLNKLHNVEQKLKEAWSTSKKDKLLIQMQLVKLKISQNQNDY